jgi:tetratricopeptide (TPR) repeat protein
LIGIVYYSLKRDRVFAFGIVFYVINLLLVLQFLPVGSAVIAERYTYIPYIGLFFIVGWLIAKYANNSIQKSFTIIVPVTVLFAVLTWKQVSMWQTSTKLWDNAIKNQPSYKAYANRALIYREEQNFDRAIEYYNEAIKLNIMDYEGYANRGNVYFYLNKPEQAFNDYRRALSLKPDYYPALDNMGAEFAMQGKYDSALKYSSQAILIKPDYKPAYSNRALTYMKLNRNEEAIKDWQKFLEYEPEAADVYNMIGTCYQAMGKYQESLVPINKAIQMNPVADFYLNRSYSYNGLKNTEAAKQDALKAKQLGLQIPADYAKSLGIQ